MPTKEEMSGPKNIRNTNTRHQRVRRRPMSIDRAHAGRTAAAGTNSQKAHNVPARAWRKWQ
jgi:hypothetical protein